MRKKLASNRVIGTMPCRPARSDSVTVSGSLPIGLSTPIPVITAWFSTPCWRSGLPTTWRPSFQVAGSRCVAWRSFWRLKNSRQTSRNCSRSASGVMSSGRVTTWAPL